MTQQQISRVRQALTETHALLSKELTYREGLRHPEMVTFYLQHIAKLEKMLAAA